MRNLRLITMLLLAGLLSGAAEAANKTFSITVNGQATDKIDTNYTANTSFSYSSPTNWTIGSYRYIHIRLYLYPNNATNYSQPLSTGVEYNTTIGYLYTTQGKVYSCSLTCYDPSLLNWNSCSNKAKTANISIMRCMGRYASSSGAPTAFRVDMSATAQYMPEDTKNLWTGRDYNSYGDAPSQPPVNEYWGNTTIATPAINITNASAPPKPRINLGQTFEYNITVRNENTTNHTGKAYGVFLYPLTDGINLTASTPAKMDIASNGSHAYRLTFRANRTMASFWVGARDNGTSTRAIFNSTFLVDTINVTDQLIVGIMEPTNQSYKGGTLLNITANITDINGFPFASGVSAYANITGIKNGIRLYYQGGSYKGDYTINTTQPTPWEIIVYANDSAENRGANTTFFYDRIAPIVANLSAPNITDRQNATMNVSVWDAVGVSEVKAQVLWATTGTLRNYTLTNYSGNRYSATIPQSEVEPGVHNVTIFANDTSGNLNSSARTTFRVNDTTPPLLENTSIRDSNENESALLNISAWDISGINRVWVRTSTGNYSMQYQSGNTYYLTIQLPAGEYNLTFNANDTSGNVNTTTGTLRVNDTTPPDITVIKPESGAQIKLGENQSITANVTDNYAGVDKVWAIVDSNQSKRYVLNYTNGLYNYSITESMGLHRVDVYANDTKNNTINASAYFTVIADVVIKELSPDSPSPQNAGKNITWTTTVENAAGTIYYQYNISQDGGNSWAIARGWNESSTFVWRTNGSDGGLNLVRVYISNSSGAQLGNRTSAAYNISTTYRIEAGALQYGTYMRGENLTFSTRVFDAQNSEVAGLQANASLTEGQASLAYNGTHYTGLFTVPANATAGEWTVNVSAQDAYNSGSWLARFNISSAYALQMFEPYSNDSYMRGDSAIINMTIKNARGETLRNISAVGAYLQKGAERKDAIGLSYLEEYYLLYFSPAFNTTDSEGTWQVIANASQNGNSGNSTATIRLNATLVLSATPATAEVYTPIRVNFSIDRADTIRQKENASLQSPAYFYLNNTESTTSSYLVITDNTPFASEYSYGSDSNGTGVNKTGAWRLRINMSSYGNYGETEAAIQVADTKKPAAKTLKIGDSYRGTYFENANGARAYPNDSVRLTVEYFDNYNTTAVNLTVTSPDGANTTLQMEKYWSKECKLWLGQQDCDDTTGSGFGSPVYQISKWNSSFSSTAQAGNYTISRLDGADSSGNINTTTPGFSFEIAAISIAVSLSSNETNVSEPITIAANISGNLTALEYVRINVSGREGSFEYEVGAILNANISYTSTRSDLHTLIVKVKSANHLSESTGSFWANYGTPILTTKLSDDQTQLNGTYKTVNMSVTAVGGDLGNVRIGSTTTNNTVLMPDFGADTMAVLGDINSSETAVFPFGFTANESGTVNITMIIRADNAKTTEVAVTYLNYSVVSYDTQPPAILYVNTTTAAGLANINESVKIYAKIEDNVDVAGANVTINCTDAAYNKANEPMGEETINTEHVWAYQFTFSGQAASCWFNVTAEDSSGLQAEAMRTNLTASTAYLVSAAKSSVPEPLMRGEGINFTAGIRTVNGLEVLEAGITYNLTKPDNSTVKWQGGGTSGYAIMQSDAGGTYLLKINASKYGNAGNTSLTFSVNSILTLEPQYTQGVMRGNTFVFNTTVKNARGQDYDAAVNLTFLNQTFQLGKIFSRYTHEQQIPLGSALGSGTARVTAEGNNNTAEAEITVQISPANLSMRNLRAENALGSGITIGNGDNVTIIVELLAQNGEPVTNANITASASTGELINFSGTGGNYRATLMINASQQANITINMTANRSDNNPARGQLTINPINKKWRDVDSDGYLEFAEDPEWLQRYDSYKDISPASGPYSREFHHFPLSPKNGFMVVTAFSSYPDVFWSPADSVNTSINKFDLDPSAGNGYGNPYEYYVDTDGDGNFEKQYANGQLKAISGKKLAYGSGNTTHLYAFDLQNIGRYDKIYDVLGDTTIFCGGARYTMLGYLLGNSEQSEYFLGKSGNNIPNWYWDAKTNSQYTIFNDALNSYYVEADGRLGKTDGDLLMYTTNGTCSFAIAACGNGQCQSQYGETTLTCPADCTSTTPPSSPGGGPSGGPSGAPPTVQTAKPPANATDNEPEGFDIIIQSPANLLVTKGNNLTFQITLASTRKEYPLRLFFRTDCCNYSYSPQMLVLAKGGSSDMTVRLSTALSTKAGEYSGEFTATYANYTKSRAIQIKVEESPAILEFSDLKRTLLLLKENIRQLNQTDAETKKADEEYSAILAGIAEAENAVEENDPGKLAVMLQQTKAKQEGLSDTVKVLMKKQGIEEQRAAIVLPEQPSYIWAIFLFTFLIIGSAASIIFREQIKEKMFRKAPEEELEERIGELKAEEARIVQMKKSTEREYFSRKLDQKTFMHIMSDYESKQIDIKARLAEAQQKLGELTKPKSGSEKVELLELQKNPAGRKMLEQAKKIGDELEKGDYNRALESYKAALEEYNRITAGLAMEEQKFLYDELNKEYAKLEEFRTAAKKTSDLYSALRNCKNCISSEKYDLAKHFFEQAQSLHRELSGSEFYRKDSQHGEIEKLYKEISEFHKSVE